MSRRVQVTVSSLYVLDLKKSSVGIRPKQTIRRSVCCPREEVIRYLSEKEQISEVFLLSLNRIVRARAISELFHHDQLKILFSSFPVSVQGSVLQIFFVLYSVADQLKASILTLPSVEGLSSRPWLHIFLIQQPFFHSKNL